ncbi:hypothetical protein OPV22_014242 [Ensete ventricosum]|uniref:Uncharacterized protein n=1 Tax=Ensete ventricosum TaxID=4639 RepID=A0AAV8R6P8_ENSVE|nr:hypothetical protein OPV22_014242 [Ensete ventricosum]
MDEKVTLAVVTQVKAAPGSSAGVPIPACPPLRPLQHQQHSSTDKSEEKGRSSNDNRITTATSLGQGGEVKMKIIR